MPATASIPVTHKTFDDATLYAELWVSLASLLRSYTAVHGLNRKEQATVELGENRIMVRAGLRWLELDRQGAEVNWKRDDSSRGAMHLTQDGKLSFQAAAEPQEEEMDMQAEAWARELML